jgi:integrase
LVEPLPSLADARDQDLRDTAVTWLARAGCTMPEIAQITGHSLQSIQQTLKHYLASHPEIADHAIAKLVAWYDGQMAGV